MVPQTDCRKNSVLIIYTSGAYGTFLDWCINYFSGQIADDCVPFQTNGNAHGWRGCSTGDVNSIDYQTIDWWLNNGDVPLVLRTHMHDDMYCQQEFLLRYAPHFRKVILMCNHVDCHLLILQNMLTKTKCIDPSTFFTQVADRFRQQFRTDQVIPRWQLREMISYWHEDWHCFMTDLYQQSDHPSVINVHPRRLIEDFEQCLIELFQQLDIKMSRRSDLEAVKDRWLALQKFKDIDQQCCDIVKAVVTNQNISTAPLDNNVINEAFVLYKLRVEHNLDFACTGVDDFPVDSQTLREKTLPYIDCH